MGMKLTRTKMRMMLSNITTTASARSTSLRIIGAVIAMSLLLWTICYGYQAASQPQRRPSHGCQWISRVGALVMLIGFLLLALGLPIVTDLFLQLSEELQYPEENCTPQSSNLNVKVDASV